LLSVEGILNARLRIVIIIAANGGIGTGTTAAGSEIEADLRHGASVE
jgi:hypothetical protein